MATPEAHRDRHREPTPAFAEGFAASLVGIVLVLLLSVMQYDTLRKGLLAELATQAEIVGRTASAAMLFNSASDGQEILESLAGAPTVVRAQLVKSDGLPLAEYLRAGSASPWWTAYLSQVEVTHTIMVNGKAVGQLRIAAELAGVWTGLARFVGGAVVVMLVALGVTLIATRRLGARVKEVEARTRFMATHDALTGLPNRSSFQMLLEHAQSHWQRRSRSDALLFIDIDNFKQINDRLGHAAGDAVLKSFAERLRNNLRASDAVARLSGDEFAVLLENVDAAASSRVANQLLQCLPAPVAFEGSALRVSASVGIALLPNDATSPDEAVRCADTAMYEAKRAGKDACHFYSQALGDAMQARLALEAELRAGLQRGELSLAYQPIYDAAGIVASFEALARWQHPTRGWVSPQEFIGAAEQSELIAALGLHILRVLHADLAGWAERGIRMPRVALNLSARQFRRPGNLQAYLSELHELSLGPDQVEFELTESNIFEDLESSDSTVVALQARGYGLSIDDFGTGYSALAYLRRIRCSKLKIDRSFVAGVSASADASALARSMIDVAHALRMQVVAEGVEEEPDYSHLREMGCDLYQGYLLGRPLTTAQVMRLMQGEAAARRETAGLPG